MTQESDAKPSEAAEPTTPDAPVEESVEPTPTFGFNDYAEKINGRFAMIGLTILVLLELATHQDLFTWLGLR